MRARLDQVYQYRRLLARCRSEAGLEMAEIEELAALEAQLRADPPPLPGARIPAFLRGPKVDDRVSLTAAGATSMGLDGCPYLDAGRTVEISVDDPENARTFRFKAIVTAVEDGEGGLYRLGVELVGSPLVLRRRPRTVELVAEAA